MAGRPTLITPSIPLRPPLQPGPSALFSAIPMVDHLPAEVTQAVAAVRSRLPEAQLGIHVHNDGGLAVANTLAAIEGGACRCRAPSMVLVSAAAM